MGKKDVADSFFATKGRLFALVNTYSGHLGFRRSSTESDIYSAVDLTGPWAKYTIHLCKITLFPPVKSRPAPLLLNSKKFISIPPSAHGRSFSTALPLIFPLLPRSIIPRQCHVEPLCGLQKPFPTEVMCLPTTTPLCLVSGGSVSSPFHHLPAFIFLFLDERIYAAILTFELGDFRFYFNYPLFIIHNTRIIQISYKYIANFIGRAKILTLFRRIVFYGRGLALETGIGERINNFFSQFNY